MAKRTKISKTAAVRAAIDAGAESPEQGIKFVKTNYGIEISKAHFFTIKSTYRRKRGLPPTRRGRPKRLSVGRPATRPALNGKTDILDAIEAIKPLVTSLGADKVKRLVDLLG